MPIIRVPDLAKATMDQDQEAGSSGEFSYLEFEVSKQKADNWNRLNEKERLTLVLKADREGRDVRDSL